MKHRTYKFGRKPVIQSKYFKVKMIFMQKQQNSKFSKDKIR